MSRGFASALLLLAACGNGGDEAPAPATTDGTPAQRWAAVTVAGLRVSVPEAWTETVWPRHETEVHFFGPEVDGFRPQFQVIHYPAEMPAAAWAELRTDKVRADPRNELLGTGRARVGPWSASTAVFRWTDDAGREITNVDYYFTTDGHVGMLRGVAPTARFLRLRPLFDAMAARIRQADAGSSSR